MREFVGLAFGLRGRDPAARGIHMANYLLVYHGGGMPDTPAQQEAVMLQWNQWVQQIGSAVVDGRNPVGRAQMVASNGAVSERGGATPVTGYSVLKADSLDAAVQLAQGCPILTAGASIQVCETFDAM